MTLLLPTMQYQNPAISGCPLGWASCTCFAAAMAAAFDRGTSFVMKGCAVRTLTHDTSGGTTLAQVDQALLSGWGVNLNTVYRLPWESFAKKINAGCGAILQGGYAPIADSRYDAGNGFRGNHAVFVAPGWIAMDPLADGRQSGVYKFHREAYPQSLLRSFAGQLDLGNGNRLGAGLVYASFTRDNLHTYRVAFDAGAFWVYTVSKGVITGRHAKRFPTATGAPCSYPVVTSWPGNGSRSLVRMTAGALEGQYVGVPQANAHLQVVP